MVSSILRHIHASKYEVQNHRIELPMSLNSEKEEGEEEEKEEKLLRERGNGKRREQHEKYANANWIDFLPNTLTHNNRTQQLHRSIAQSFSIHYKSNPLLLIIF